MRLLFYFLLTFATTWTAWFATSQLAAPGNTGIFGGTGPVFLLAVFAPGLVALAFTAHAEGRAALQSCSRESGAGRSLRVGM